MCQNKIDLALIEKLEEAKVTLMLLNPVFSSLTVGKKLVEASHLVSDISVDGEHVYYNSDFLRGFDKGNLIFLMMNQSLSFLIKNFIFKNKNNEMNEDIYLQSIDIKTNTILMKSLESDILKKFEIDFSSNFIPDGLYINKDYLNLDLNEVYNEIEKLIKEENENNSIEDSLKMRFPNGTATKTIKAKNKYFNENLIKTIQQNGKEFYYLDDSATIEDISTSFFLNKVLKESIDLFKSYQRRISVMETYDKSIFSYIKKIEALACEENEELDQNKKNEYNVFENNNEKTKVRLSLSEQFEIGRQSVEILKNEYLDLSKRFSEIGEKSIFSAKENIENMDEKLEEDRISFYERYENFINFARLNFDNDLFVKYVVVMLIRNNFVQPNNYYFKDKKTIKLILNSIGH